MKPYIFLPHTADAKFQAWGKTFDEALKNAAYAMTDIITDHTQLRSYVKRKIKVTSESQEALLYDFLEQLLYLLDTDGFLLNEIKELKLLVKKNRFVLIASLLGDNHPAKYEIKTTIKAVTYQEMFVKHEKDRVTVQVVVDI